MKSVARFVVLCVLAGGCGEGGRADVGAAGGAPSGGGGTPGDGAVTGGSASGGSASGGSASGGAPSGGGGTPPAFPGDSYFDGTSRLQGLAVVDCTVTVKTEGLSSTMATVGIVTFSTDLPNLSQAEIHFGLDTTYGLVAPVNLAEPDYRTLLLGMRQASTYHYRVAVGDGASVCYGADRTIQTGILETVAGDVVALSDAWTSDDAAPGFIVTSHDGDAVIYDKGGELVWAYPMWNVFSVRMSWDGQYLLGRDPGPFDLSYGGIFYRVRMDGSDPVEIDAPGGDHHDFTPTPNGIAYLAKVSEGDCDSVYEASIDLIDGVPIFDTWELYQYFPDVGVEEGTELCHANRIRYSLEGDFYTISDRNKDAIVVFSTSGEPLASIGKAPTTTVNQHILAEGAGPGGDWHVQHGHHLYADDKLIVFSNESSGGAALLHYTLDGQSARLDWKYTGAGASTIQGDAERLPNGNFLITANQSGIIAELKPDGMTEVSRYVLSAPAGPMYRFGYSEHRASLYGTPPPR